MSPVPPLPYAVLLGVLQGLTEFLPVSSSGHVAAAQLLFPALSYPGVTLEVATHLGTTVAVVLYYRRLVRALIGFGAADSEELLGVSRIQWCLLLSVGTLPAALVGLLARDAVLAAFESYVWISMGLVASGAVLMLSRLAPRTGEALRWTQALAIGVAQSVAILPGVSRSALTITTALLLGVPRRQSVTFSFLLSIPAILGAAVLDTAQLVGEPIPVALLLNRLLFATLFAGTVGFFCIGLVHRATDAGWWHRFAWYCWLAALVLVVAAH